jgi:FtsZ-binding cell division protein ZapB
LEQAAERLLEKKRALSETCRRLEAEKAEWYEQRKALLAKVDEVLARLDEHLEQEES